MTQAVALAQQASTGVSQGFKNRIINGAMVIDQRNAGASITVTAAFPPAYSTDRFYVYGGVTSKFTAQQNAGSVTPPTGFTNYLGFTSLSAYSVGSSDNFLFGQYIEGFNVADLDFGKATAKTVTLSFWVRSSLTGTFGGSLVNSASNRSYVFSYTISSANTWEQKSITITGDTTGTWAKDNGIGLALNFSIGSGSTFSTTAGSWVTGNFLNVTGATSVVGTNGATFYITGVQLEVGSTATSFDTRSVTTELQLCQRYAWKYGGAINDQYLAGTGIYFDGNVMYCGPVQNPVTMRATPSMTTFGTPAMKLNGSPTFGFTPAIGVPSVQNVWVEMTKTGHGLSNSLVLNLNTGTTSDYFIFSAELS
jgi:hypothetical protein